MKFLTRARAPFRGGPLPPRPMGVWRAAADLVWMRWEIVRDAGPELRPAAFAAYLAALDAEASAAANLAETTFGHAA